MTEARAQAKSCEFPIWSILIWYTLNIKIERLSLIRFWDELQKCLPQILAFKTESFPMRELRVLNRRLLPKIYRIR
jgi:hypothetical protein